MTVIPLDDRIIVRPSEAVSARDRPDIPSDPTEDRPIRGTVIAAGTGTLNGRGEAVPLAVQAGDTVLFGKHLGCMVTFGDGRYWLMKAEDILKIEARPAAVVLYGDRSRRS